MPARGRKYVDEQIIFALVVGGDVAAAARHARCSEKTVRRRLAEPSFARRVSEARAELRSRAIGRLSFEATATVETLVQLRNTADAETVKLGACRLLIESMFRGGEIEGLAGELSELRQAVEDLQREHRHHAARDEQATPAPGSTGNGRTSHPGSATA
jgi:hypothetical protein